MPTHTVSVLGGGSFGTVIANIVAANGYKVNFWMRNPDLVDEVNRTHENPHYLPGYQLDENVHATADIEQAVSGSRLVFVAVPSAYFRTVVRKMLPALTADTILVSTTKGIEAGSFLLMSQVMREEAPGARIGVLSGPNLASEIARRNLAGTVIASNDDMVRDRVRDVLKSEYFRVYTNDDMFGVELGGSLKNIYAIIAGLASAMGMGQNTNGMLITRSLTEMARFGRELGADPMTFLGLSGVGDLIVTCSSSLSRNFRVGFALGQGKSLEEAVAEIGQVAEGVNTLKLVKEKADELGIYMPLASGLYQIVYEGKPVSQVISALMLGEGALDVEYEAHQSKTLN
ncbi:NAD(P)H-dependent glycerol-3-phosphate dehydrogenase [Pseudohongiella sp.]|uniref:Glycerol-3-phosphate dehydrogenase NAD-dependent N-terminal domain-containing protein n=1 Tax=marine sediment metagenome TaxID=412755 RepID=A0A0F9YHF0_9ZZZZ|nr:NAD(P)H-dependent glycerol-3-phosphate dehydrogenase [Pseudohongiella sp.]HDZ09063.1 NAD(P)H-dependent glycerol-3-phosphate dehydrogenase [Pseudohongiella sp.]HEA62748.1 NAD(P)H-dependent glycerol-3-phosphate dehydrogenase [Pseudohongiella sp.]